MPTYLVSLLLWQKFSLFLYVHNSFVLWVHLFVSFLFFIQFLKFTFHLPFITKYGLYFPCCTIHPWAYLTPNSLYLALPHAYIAPPPSTLATTSLFSMSVSLLLLFSLTDKNLKLVAHYGMCFHRRHNPSSIYLYFFFICFIC